VYSFGTAAEWSFDSALKEYGCSVHGFDPSVDAAATAERYNADGGMGVDDRGMEEGEGVFHPWGLGPEGTYPAGEAPLNNWPGMSWLTEVNHVEWELKGLKSTMATLGHRYVDVLKVDVDGCEWSLIDELLNDRSLDVEQLVIELHFDPLESKADREVKERKLQGLEAVGFVPVSIIKPNDHELEVSYVNTEKGWSERNDEL